MVCFYNDIAEFAYDALGGSSLAYDAAGNLTTDADGYEYEYDYENRIVKITKDGNGIAEFAYDALGRRVRKIDSIATETRLYYYNDRWQVLCEYDGNDIPKRWYAYGNYIDEVLVTNVISAPALCKYYVHDHLYSPVALASAGGTVQERYEYDAYGACTIQEPNHAPRAASLYSNSYAFQGKRLDMLDDGNLEIMAWPYRNYSPDIGRWSQAEKLGMIPNDDPQINPFDIQKQYKYGMNLYLAFASNPMITVDPLGLKPNCCKIKQSRSGQFIGGDFPYTSSDTTCTQNTVNYDCSPKAACCAAYKGNKNIRVYEAKEGPCCWCSVAYFRDPGLFGHADVRLNCDQGRYSWRADVIPSDGIASTIYERIKVRVLFNNLGGGQLAGRVSCDAADKVRASLEGTYWNYNFFVANCRHFARKTINELMFMCP